MEVGVSINHSSSSHLLFIWTDLYTLPSQFHKTSVKKGNQKIFSSVGGNNSHNLCAREQDQEQPLLKVSKVMAVRPTAHTLNVEDTVNNPRKSLVPGMPGTRLGIGLRAVQVISGSVGLVVMSTTSDIKNVGYYRFFMIATCLQIIWSLTMGLLDIQARRRNRQHHNRLKLKLFTTGDGVMWCAMLSFASALLEFFFYYNDDINDCANNACTVVMASGVMALMCWCSLSFSFFLSLWLCI